MDTSVSVFFCERSFLCRKFTLCVYNLVVSAQVMVTNQTVTEGDTISVDLSVQGAKKPFPPTTTSVWMFNGQNLFNSSSTVLNDFDITLNNVQRNMSGNYTLIVTNSVGSSTGTLELDVQCEIECLLYASVELIANTCALYVLNSVCTSLNYCYS